MASRSSIELSSGQFVSPNVDFSGIHRRIGHKELETVLRVVITKLIRQMCEEDVQNMDLLQDPRLIRLAVARAKSTGDLGRALRNSITS